MPSKVQKTITLSIKSTNQLDQLKKRQKLSMQGILNFHITSIQQKQSQFLTQLTHPQYHPYPPHQLRQLNSNIKAFSHACLICKTCKKLSHLYGNFIFNQKMLFKSLQDELIIWLNTDLFSIKPKIYLPGTHDGQLAMIKSLVNYFKLWLQLDYQGLGVSNTLEELEVKIVVLKNKVSHLQSNLLKVQTQFNNDQSSNNKKSYTSSKNLDSRDKYSFRSKKLQKNTPSIKNSENSSHISKDNTANRIQFRHVFNFPQYSSKHSTNRLSVKKSQKNNNLQRISDNGQDISYNFNDYFEQKPQSTPILSTMMSRTTGPLPPKLFPFKTTSASSNKILQLIRSKDSNPDEYIKNQIKIDPQKMKQLQEQQLKNKLKKSLNQVGEQLDNLFMSNMEENIQNKEEELQIIEKQFEGILLG